MDPRVQRLTVHPTPVAAREAVRRVCEGEGAALRPPHISFRQLETAWSRAAARRGSLRGRPLSETARHLLAMKAARSAYGEDAARSWSRCLVVLADELAQIGMDPGELERSVRAVGGPLGARGRHATELYRRYREAIPADRVDALDLNRAMIAEAGGGLPPPWDGAREVRFVHVGLLNPFRQRLLMALLGANRHAVRIVPAFDMHVAETLLARHIEPAIASSFLGGTFEPPPFSGLAEALIERSPDILAASGLCGRVRIERSVGLYGEVEDAGRRVRALIEGGCAPHEIGVAARTLAPYGQAIADVFRRFGIPLNFRRGIPARLSPAVRAVLALMECARDGLPIPGLADALDNPLLEDWPMASGRRAAAVRALRDWRLPRLDAAAIGSAAVRTGMDDAVDGRSEDAAEELRALCSWTEAWGGSCSAGAFARRLREELRRGGVANAVRAVAVDRGSMAAAVRGFVLLDDLLSEIEEADAAVQASPMDPAAFLDFLGERLDALTVPMPPETGGVDVRNAFDLAGLSYRHLFILGMNDGVFPSNPPPAGLLPDELRDALNRDAGPARRLHTRRFHAAGERVLFLQSLQAAREGIWLFARFHDGQVAELVPSTFLEDAADLVAPGTARAFPGEAGPSGGGAPPLDACVASDETVHRIFLASGRHRAAAAGADSRERSLAAAAVRALGDRERFAEAIDRIRIEAFRESSEAGGAPHPRGAWAFDLRGVSSALDAIERRLRRPLSPTAIERLARCGAAFFLGDVLGLEPREVPEPTVDPRDEGQAVHRLVAAVYAGLLAGGDGCREIVIGDRRCRAVDPSILRDDALLDARIEAGSRSLARRFETPRARGGLRELRGVSLASIRRSARAVFEFDRGLERPWLVLRVEQSFGPGAPAPWGAWEIRRGTTAAPPWVVHGRIDRIDLELDEDGRPARLWVTDLKSPSAADSSANRPDDLPAGRLAQLPIYAAVASRLAPELDVDGRLLAYGSVPHRKRAAIRLGDLLARAKLPLAARDFVAPRTGAGDEGDPEPGALEGIVGDLLERAVRGEFGAVPEECDAYCPFASVCGRPTGDAQP